MLKTELKNFKPYKAKQNTSRAEFRPWPLVSDFHNVATENYFFICQNTKLGPIFGGNLLICEFSKHGVFVIYCYITDCHTFSSLKQNIYYLTIPVVQKSSIVRLVLNSRSHRAEKARHWTKPQSHLWL